MILAFLVLGCAAPAEKVEVAYMGQTQRYLRTHSEAVLRVEAEEGTKLGFSTFILEVDISPLYVVRTSFSLKQVTCSLRTTVGSDWPSFWI